MSVFCSLDEAFASSVVQPKKKKSKAVAAAGAEGFAVPQTLTGSVADPERMKVPEPMRGADAEAGSQDRMGAVNMQEFFPLPGETAEPDEWQKAFMLEPSQVPQVKPDGSVAVAGRPTLWRQIPVPARSTAVIGQHEEQHAPVAPVASSLAGIPAEVQQRLDKLTRQLDSLGAPTQLQSTAELFLFVAIGLLILLAMDTLLRFAVRMARGPQGGGRRLRMGRLGKRWV